MVWASVPYMFTQTELLTEIWRSIPGSSGVDEKCPATEMSFGMLQQAVQGLVASRRYLLVLDDVCNDESGHGQTEKMRTTWEDVLAPFRDGGNGSRILVTCRATICAKVLGAGTKITLNGLGADDLVLVLKKIAFGDAQKKTPPLDDVIRSVAEQLRGSPSAAKTVVDMMKNRHRKKDWKKLLEKAGSWYCGAGLASEAPLACAAGASTYRNLPQHLRSCLGFCSMFPDKWEFEPETLVKMWIAHGIICGDHGQSMEGVGREYVGELQKRSMLKTISRDGRATCFVIHDQVHSMLMSVCATEFFRLSNDDLIRRRGNIPASVRHLSLTGGGCLALAQLKDDPVLKKLRTLLVFDDGRSSSSTAVFAIDNHVLKQLKAITVLDFAGTRITELPKAVGKLKHLRYLGLPDSAKSLPAAVTKLLHLQTLSLGKDCKLDEDHGFPGDGMSNLVNLRHLDMDMKYVAMIRRIGRLERFQGSVEFCADRGKGHGMEELAGMDSLHGTLTVKGLQAVAGKEEAQKAQLGKKESLKTLKLEWELPKLGGRTCSTSTDSQEQVLEGLQPNGRLQELRIQRYQGTSSPGWLGSNLLTSLSHLILINCRNWQALPCLSQLPDLRMLHLKEMYAIARIDHKLYGAGVLRSLEKLVLDDMPNLIEWSADSTEDKFPRLQEILILNCPRLAKLPRVPATVKNMRIEKDNSSYYLDMAFSPKSSSFTLDVHGEAVQLLQQDLLHQDHALAVRALSISKYAGETDVNVKLLSSVRSLSLSRCVVTDRLLGVFFLNLQSLEKLRISDCGEVRTFPEYAMPPSLKSIELNGCHPKLAEKLRGSARICSIPRVHIC
ncbi:putative disease resistance protein RGA3 [Triticum urartu]|uniref:putative disease resistance protein RGA3 n=1 Tax=Triticum urartu TaxID=4572 RepID=UPI002042DF4C|nr:putative disease resistance protein RGA3 [Triticum urartu]